MERLTTDGRSTLSSWAPRGDWIAYLREVSKTQNQLRIMKLDGSEDTQVSPIGFISSATWSWGGDKIAYTRANTSEEDSQTGVFIFDVVAGVTTPISQPFPLSATGFRSRRDGGGSSRGRFSRGGRSRWSPDDRYVTFNIAVGENRREEVWLYDSETGKFDRFLARRGQVTGAYWSGTMPPRIVARIQSSGEGFDIGVANPDGTGLTMLTDIGSASVEMDDASWNPVGEDILYLSDIDMTEDEQENFRRDVFVSTAAGGRSQNLTQASSPSTEEQISIFGVRWSWDGRLAIGGGARYDKQGNDISARWLIDPAKGTYRLFADSDPQGTGKMERFRRWEWSYDSNKIGMLSKRWEVRNWGDDPELINEHSALLLYDVKTETMHDILVYDLTRDRKEVSESFSISPDNRSIMITVFDVLSAEENISKPDIYRVYLPESLIDADASQFIGPPIGRGEAPEGEIEIVREEGLPSLPPEAPETNGGGPVNIRTITPQHMTVDEALASIPGKYGQYLTANTARNMFLFHGPLEMYDEIVYSLGEVDFPAPHLIIDLMGLEMSDEANRALGLDWSFVENRFGVVQPEGLAPQNLIPDPRIAGVTTPTAILDAATEAAEAVIPAARTGAISTFPGVGQVFFGSAVGTLPEQFFIRLTALEKEGSITILANPRNVAESGKESVIEIRKTLNFFFQEGFDFQGRPIVKKSDITAETNGRITPTLLADGRINLAVDVTVGTFTFTPEDDLPELTQRKASTEVKVQDGETLVIGGLRQQELILTESRTPILGQLPWVGRLFRKNNREIRHSVLTILITPHVLDPDGEVPEWPVLNGDQHGIVPIMEDATIMDESKQLGSPEWTQKIFGGIRNFLGFGPEEKPED